MMLRLVFEKTGDSVWISHLDLMRVFQRAFRRAGLFLKHSQGFTPRAIVSIALPLSVGTESVCELLDFELEGEIPACSEIVDKLNGTLPAGIQVRTVYEAQRKIKELTHLRGQLVLEYDSGIPAEAEASIRKMLERESLIVVKHSRKGDTETDARPLLKDYSLKRANDNTLILEVLVCAQNPSLNPQLLADAVQAYCPGAAADFSYVRRLEIYDAAGEIFR